MTRGELLDRMDSRELTAWQLFSAIEPIGDRRADLRAAMIASVLANANRDPDKQANPFELADFLVYQDADDLAEQETRDQQAHMATLLDAWGAPPDG
jgi:hypothetical protein